MPERLLRFMALSNQTLRSSDRQAMTCQTNDSLDKMAQELCV